MWSKPFTIITKHKFVIIACLIIAGYLLPYYILGENTHIRVHDNLDSNIVWYKMLAESGQIFTLTDVPLPNVINGLPRSALPSAFDGMILLYVLFEPMTAYTIGQTLMRFVAFFGMYLLLKNHVLRGETIIGKNSKKDHSIKYHVARGEKFKLIAVGSGLAFAMLPYWPSGMLSIAGLPLALYLFLNIRKGGFAASGYNWLVLLLIPFFSNFILSFVFFLGLMGVLWLVDWIRSKKVNWAFFSAIAAMITIYLVKNYLLITTMFFDGGFTSHREELDLGHNTLSRTFGLALENSLTGHTHDEAWQRVAIIPAIGLAFLVAAFRNIKPKLLLGLFFANLAISIWYAFWYWEGMRVIKDNVDIANTFNFSRIHFLDPLIWYICFALALAILWKHLKFGQIVVGGLIIIQCGFLFLLNEETKYSEIGTPTFKEFYAEELFDEIESYIGEDQSEYRVVSIGMHPTIAQYNGFFTLDTYNNSYPLEYKHQFREIIAPELGKNPTLESYFDTWGGRMYMYVGQLGKNYMFTKDYDEVIEDLDVNTEALKELGGDYIFSALPIENHEELGLELENTFVMEEFPWEVRLYRVE